MRAAFAVALVALAGLIAAGCGSPRPKGEDLGSGLTIIHPTVDGRTVTCIVYRAGKPNGLGVGIDCDWGRP